ncbi:MAG TPA: EAL domain-containing protein [Actinoplanes sp.]|nr:EAL domain-containing protein [Actinoplanes sp.]
MGAWLLGESVRQLGEWTAQRGPGARPLHVSVHVAVRQLRDGSLVRLVDDALRENGLPPSALWLEITESGVMEDLETAVPARRNAEGAGSPLIADPAPPRSQTDSSSYRLSGTFLSAGDIPQRTPATTVLTWVPERVPPV